MSNTDMIVGIDEVGRGPLAGPVMVGCVAMERVVLDAYADTFATVADSKRLSHAQRARWFTRIRQWQQDGILTYTVTRTTPQVIDRIGIVPSITRALNRGLTQLNCAPADTYVRLDGGLHAPEVFHNQETIIGGDVKEPLISLASIAAKEIRDAYMVRMDDRYQGYGFAAHKGYGTKAHCAALKTYGPCPLHRMSFIRSYVA